MKLPEIAVVPKFTEANTSKKGFINQEDVNKIVRNLIVFLIPTATLYLAQLSGALANHMYLNLKDVIPSTYVIGAFEGYVIAALLDYLKKLNDGKN